MLEKTESLELLDEEIEPAFRELCVQEGWLNEEEDIMTNFPEAETMLVEDLQQDDKEIFVHNAPAFDRSNLDSDAVFADKVEEEETTKQIQPVDTCEEMELCGDSDILKPETEMPVDMCSPKCDDTGLEATSMECIEEIIASPSTKFVDSGQPGLGEGSDGTLEVCIIIEDDGEKNLIEEYLRSREQGRYMDLIFGTVTRVEENRSSSSASERVAKIEDNVVRTHAVATTVPTGCDPECLTEQLHVGREVSELELDGLQAGKTRSTGAGTETAGFGSMESLGTAMISVAGSVIKQSGPDISTVENREEDQLRTSMTKEGKEVQARVVASEKVEQLFHDVETQGDQNLVLDVSSEEVLKNCQKMDECPEADLLDEDIQEQGLAEPRLPIVRDGPHQGLGSSETCYNSKREESGAVSITEERLVSTDPGIDQVAKSVELIGSSGSSELCTVCVGKQEVNQLPTIGTATLTIMDGPVQMGNDVSNADLVSASLLASAENEMTRSVMEVVGDKEGFVLQKETDILGDSCSSFLKTHGPGVNTQVAAAIIGNRGSPNRSVTAGSSKKSSAELRVTQEVGSCREKGVESLCADAVVKDKEVNARQTTITRSTLMEAAVSLLDSNVKGNHGCIDTSMAEIGDSKSQRVGQSKNSAGNAGVLESISVQGGLNNGTGKLAYSVGGLKKLARKSPHIGNDVGQLLQQSQENARVTRLANVEENVESRGRKELQTGDLVVAEGPNSETIPGLQGRCQSENLKDDPRVPLPVIAVRAVKHGNMVDENIVEGTAGSSGTIGGESNQRMGLFDAMMGEKEKHRGKGKVGELIEIINGGEEEDEEDDVEYNPLQEVWESRRAPPTVPSKEAEEVIGTEGRGGDFQGRKYRIIDGFWELRSEIDAADDEDEFEEEDGMVIESEEGTEICLPNGEAASSLDKDQGLESSAVQGLPSLRSHTSELTAVDSPQLSRKADMEGAIWTRTRASYSLVDVSIDTLESFLPETNEEDYFEIVNDEEEYHKFLSAFESVVEIPKVQQQDLQEDEETDDEDEDFDLKGQEELEGNPESWADIDGRKRRRVHRPETRQKRRQRAELQLGVNNPSMFTLPTSLPYVNGPPADPSIGKGIKGFDRMFNVFPSNGEEESASRGFTAPQIVQLHSLIHEHVQLLVQVFAVSLFDRRHQYLSERLKRMLMELVETREKGNALKKLDSSDFCFCPSIIQPCVIEEERAPVLKRTASGSSPSNVGSKESPSPLQTMDQGPTQQAVSTGLPSSPPKASFLQSSPSGSLDTSTTVPKSSVHPKDGNISGAHVPETHGSSTCCPPGISTATGTSSPETEKETTAQSPSSTPSSSLALTTIRSEWGPSIRGRVQSVLDVEPLCLVKKFLLDICRVAEEYRKEYGEEGALPEQCEMVPLFRDKMPSSQIPETRILNLVQGTLTPPQAFVRKTMAAALVESSKRQSLALVPKAVALALERFAPLFNEAVFPHKPPPSSAANRLVFTDSEDELLAMGLMMYNTDFDAIRERYLPSKSTHQIYVRSKNRSSLRAPDNTIKKVRRLKASLLTPYEIEAIQKALKKYNHDWAKVWEHCVPYRDPARLPLQWRNSLDIYTASRSFDVKLEHCHLTEGGESRAAMASQHISQDGTGSVPAQGVEKEADLTVRFPSSYEADRSPCPTPCSLQSGDTSTKKLPSMTAAKSQDLKTMTKQGGSFLQTIPPPLLSSQPMPASDSTARIVLENPFVAPTYLGPRRRKMKNQMVRLAAGLPLLKLPPTGRVMTPADVSNLPGSGVVNDKYSQSLSGASPRGLVSGHGGTRQGELSNNETGFSMRQMVFPEPGTSSGKALHGEGTSVLGKRVRWDEFSVPNIMRKRPALLSCKQGEDLNNLDNSCNGQAEENISSLNVVGQPIGQQTGESHPVQKNAISSGSLSPATKACEFCPTLKHPYWHSNLQCGQDAGLDDLKGDHTINNTQQALSVLDHPSSAPLFEITNPASQPANKNESGKQCIQILKSKECGPSKDKGGLQTAQEMDVRLDGEGRETLSELVRKTSDTQVKTSGTQVKQGGKRKAAGGIEEPVRRNKKQMVLAEGSACMKDSLLKDVTTNPSSDRHHVRDMDLSLPSGFVEQLDHTQFMSEEGSWRASRTRRLRGAGIRGMVPRIARRKEIRREQDIHPDNEEPFFEPHIIVIEAEDHSSSDCDNHINSEEVPKVSKSRKVQSSRLKRQAGEMPESTQQVPSSKQKRRAGKLMPMAEPSKATSLKQDEGAEDTMFVAESCQPEKSGEKETAPLPSKNCRAPDHADKQPGLSDNELHQSAERVKLEPLSNSERPAPHKAVTPSNDVLAALNEGVPTPPVPSPTTSVDRSTIEPGRKRDTRIPSRFYKDDMLGFIPRSWHVKWGGGRGRGGHSRGRGGHSRVTSGQRDENKKGVKVAAEVKRGGGARGGTLEAGSSRKGQSRAQGKIREEHGLDDGALKTGTEGDGATDVTCASGHSVAHKGDLKEKPPVTTEGQLPHDADVNTLQAAEVLAVSSQRPSRTKKVAVKMRS